MAETFSIIHSLSEILGGRVNLGGEDISGGGDILDDGDVLGGGVILVGGDNLGWRSRFW